MSQSIISRLSETIKYYGVKGLIRVIFFLMRTACKCLHINKGLK